MIETLLAKLNIPDSCLLDKRVYKKLFEENGRLDAADKKALREDVEEIRWLYTLKPATINIPRYADSQRDYGEVAVLWVTLSHANRYGRVAEFMQRAIPYPLVTFFNYENQVALCLADKRINQADKEKWVIEHSFDTQWLELDHLSDSQKRFLDDLSLKKLSFLNLYALYQDLCDRVVALNCAAYSGIYILKPDDGNSQQSRVEMLGQIRKLEQTLSELRNRLKQEKQMGRQVALNTEIHQLTTQMDKLKQTL